MKPDDFYQGLKGENRQSEELTAGAEHFVRLKQQTGLDQHQQAEELEKAAKVFGAHEPSAIHHAAIPHSERSQAYQQYIRSKSKEEPTGYPTALLTGGAVGAGLGALMSPPGLRGPMAAVMGAGGAGIGALSSWVDRKNIEGAKKVKNDPKAMRSAMNAAIVHRAEHDRAETRHHHIRELLKEAAVRHGLVKVAKIDPMKIALPAAGAAIGGILTYSRSRPLDDAGGKSHDELDASALAQGTKPGRGSGFLDKLKHNFATSARDVAKTTREHPFKASIVGAGGGAALGLSVAKLLGGGKK